MARVSILSAFNNHFDEFVADLLRIFPEDKDILASQYKFALLRKANPRILVSIWYTYVVEPYKAQIDLGDIRFFTEKDYSMDLTNIENPEKVIEGIDRLRDPIKRMAAPDLAKAMRYLQNLKKLAELYFSDKHPVSQPPQLQRTS
jgi:hypothetical protein